MCSEMFLVILFSHNGSGETVQRSVLAHHGVLHAPVLQDGNPVRVVQNLVHLMGNDDHRLTAVSHFPQDIKHILRFLRRQHGRRLVQNKDLRPVIKKFDDLHPLLFSHRKLPDNSRRIHLQIKASGALGDPFLHFSGIQQKSLFFRVERYIFGDCQCGNQPEMLMDHSDPQIDRILRGIDGDLFPVTENLTAVRPVNAGQNIHQRAFSCPVFSQQGVNFFCVHLQADILVCNDRTECLGNIFHLKNQFAHRAPLSVSSCSASCAG